MGWGLHGGRLFKTEARIHTHHQLQATISISIHISCLPKAPLLPLRAGGRGGA
jgi:hypothetical protein